MNYNLLPEHMREGMENYLNHGLEPGGFMMAILENDLKEAVLRADSINKHCLPAYVEFLFDHAPSQCWGSKERVQAWMEYKRGEYNSHEQEQPSEESSGVGILGEKTNEERAG